MLFSTSSYSLYRNKQDLESLHVKSDHNLLHSTTAQTNNAPKKYFTLFHALNVNYHNGLLFFRAYFISPWNQNVQLKFPYYNQYVSKLVYVLFRLVDIWRQCFFNLSNQILDNFNQSHWRWPLCTCWIKKE